MEAEQPDPASKVDECTTSGRNSNILSQGDEKPNRFVRTPNVNGEANEVCNPTGIFNSTHRVPYIYGQDVVRKNNGNMIGVVTEVAGDSDSDSDITVEDFGDDGEEEKEEEEQNDEESSDNEEGKCNENKNADRNTNENKTDGSYKSGSLTADQVRVLWQNDTESAANINDLTVIDRGFLHGDYVAAASDPTGQVGVVLDVNISVDLLAPDRSIIKGVSSRELKRVRDFTLGDYVVLGPWLGRVEDVIDNVTVLFDDGSVCKVVNADPLRLTPISKNLLEDRHSPYHPGQRVRASSSSVFKNSRWLSGLWKANRLEGTITKVTVGSVFIYWIASAGYGPDSSTAPAEEQSPKNLKLLSSFTHANWQLGDWCLLPSSVVASSIPPEKCLSEQELHESSKHEEDSTQVGSESDIEESLLEEFQRDDESLDVDVEGALDSNNVKGKTNQLHETNSSGSSMSVSKDPVHEAWPLHRKKIRKVIVRRDKKMDKKSQKKEQNFERALLIVNTTTQVDVSWQDGTIELGVESMNLIPVDSPGDHEFVPEQYVVEKASEDGAESCEVKRVGVVKSVNAKERTACVRWLRPVSRAEDPRVFEKEEVVSVYELEGHPDYDYCYGDVVVRLTPVSVSSMESAEERPQKIETSKVKPDLRNLSGGKNVGDAADRTNLDSPDLSWVGNITGLKNGDIEVMWADGTISMVGPQAIYVVDRDDDDESVAAGSAVSDDAASWETIEEDEMGALEDEKEGHEMKNASDVNSEPEESQGATSGSNAALSFPLAAFGFFTRLASGIFSGDQSNVDSFKDSRSEDEIQSPRELNVSENRDSSNESSSQKFNLIDNCDLKDRTVEKNHNVEATNMVGNAEASFGSMTESSVAQSCCEDGNYSFKRFDTAIDPLDHHFHGSNGQSNGRKWLKKVQKDWSILQNNLPDGIFVRAYEDRMDLLRAVIVGAYATPYQDGLFFFDIHLPPEYPDVPPSVYYHSGGWRINPNLYEEGKVCLSLLNTWTGRGNEVWDPSSSSILQVLVSLQGLVLNSKPYFNEAGYDKQIGTAEGEKNSLSYNENTFLLNCKTMMYLMRKPPKDFEELVKEHFRKRGYYILKACDAYMKGYLIGSLTKDASVSNANNANSTSVGFKLMLAKIMPKLYLALDDVGSDCYDFKYLLQS